MKVIKKYEEGDVVPDGAVYLNSFERVTRLGFSDHMKTSYEFYFLVDEKDDEER